MPRPIKFKSALLTIACALALSMEVLADSPRQVDVPAGSLTSALKSVAEKFGVEIAYSADQLSGMQTPGVHGEYTAESAVTKLLQGTTLRITVHESGAILISAVKGDSADRNGSESIDEVLVSAKKPFTEGNMDIRRTEDDAQPYQIIGKQEIERSGALNVEGFLKKHLTMNTVARDNSQLNINALGGASNINLRGIGSNQTLILINGRRTANVALFGQAYQPDVNGIPVGAVERIEVLPVSSSAIYGGSAIGGVVNVVLKRNYEGGQVGVSYRSPFDTSAPIRTVDASYGLSLEGGRTNIMVGGRYSDAEAPLSKDRPELFARGLSRVLSNYPAALLSPTTPFLGGSTPNIGSANGAALVLRPEYGGMSLGSSITSVPTDISGATLPSQLGAGLLANAGSYNFTAPNTVGSFNVDGLRSSVSSAPESKSFIASARRRMSDNVEVFLELYRSKRETSADWIPSAQTYLISATSPINPFQQAVTVTLPAGFNAFAYPTTNDVTRLTGGVIVDFPNDWQLESDYTWTKNEYRYSSSAYDVSGAMLAAMNNGTLNPFVDTLANPLDVSLYQGTFGSGQESGLGNVAIRVAGPVWHLPAGSPTLAIGLERREETLRSGGYFFRHFPQLAASQSLDRKYLPKSQTVLSAYTELKVPLVSKANDVPLVRELELQLSARTEHFKVATGTAFVIQGANTPVVSSDEDYSSTNPTIGLRYKPVDEFMLRASYATGFLPPDYSQFLAPLLGGTTISPNSTVNVIDPLRGNQVTPVRFIAGGNPDIKPQSSTSWSVGLVWEPTLVDGLRASLDWYHLVLEDVAVTPTAQQIVNLESSFPGRVTRGAVTPGDPYGVGQLTLVDYSLLNANEMKTEGLDVALSYQWLSERLGMFQVAAAGSFIRTFQRQSVINGPLLDITNQVANGGPLKHKGNVALTWMRGDFKADWIASYFGSYDQFNTGGVTAYVLAQGGSTIPSQTYHDLVLEYSWSRDQGTAWQSALSGTTLQLGVNNVFDKAPPFDAFYTSSMYYSPFGDPRMREYWLAVNKRF